MKYLSHQDGLRIFVSALMVLVAGFVGVSDCHAVAKAYIANDMGNTVTVINTTDHIAEVPLLTGFRGPYGVAVAPAGDFLYVTNRGDNTVSRIDLATGLETGSPATGPDPVGVGVSPDGVHVYVVNHGAGNPGLTVIDTTDNSTESISFGTAPFGIAVHPGGKLLYVTDQATGQLHVIDLSTNTVQQSLTVGSNPLGVALTASGSYAVVANSADNTVSVVDTLFNTVSDPVTVGAQPFAVVISPDGALAYVTNYLGDSVSVVSLQTFQVTAESPISVGNGPQGVSVTPNGLFVYVVNNLAGNISVIRTSDNAVVSQVAVAGSPVAFGKFIGGPVPQAPTGLSATLISDTSIDLHWTDNASGNNAELGFRVERKKYVQGGYFTIATLGPDVTSYSDSGLGYEANFYYRVVAFNDEGVSAYSNEASATTGSEEYGCFIATAAYGSLLEPQVVLLRNFRDRFLVNNETGRAFLRFYYTNSPPLARFIADHNILRFLVRCSLLPLVGLSWLALAIGFLPALFCLVLLLSMITGAVLYCLKTGKKQQAKPV